MPDYVEATIDAIRTIEPRLAGRAAEYELARRIPPDVVAELQRLRDINAAAQHAVVHTRHYLPTGAQILGHPPVHPLFAA